MKPVQVYYNHKIIWLYSILICAHSNAIDKGSSTDFLFYNKVSDDIVIIHSIPFFFLSKPMKMRISLETGFFIEISFDHLNMIKTTFKAVKI